LWLFYLKTKPYCKDLIEKYDGKVINRLLLPNAVFWQQHDLGGVDP
jgi:hypothetical protein